MRLPSLLRAMLGHSPPDGHAPSCARWRGGKDPNLGIYDPACARCRRLIEAEAEYERARER